MAVYKSVKDYLYDQYLLPLEKAIREGDKTEAIKIALFLADKYIELNAFAVAHENFTNEIHKTSFEEDLKKAGGLLEYHKKYVEPYIPTHSWKECDTVYSHPEECEIDFDAIEEDGEDDEFVDQVKGLN